MDDAMRKRDGRLPCPTTVHYSLIGEGSSKVLLDVSVHNRPKVVVFAIT